MVLPTAYIKEHHFVFGKSRVIGHMVGIGAVGTEGNDGWEGKAFGPFFLIYGKELVGAFLFCHARTDPAGNPFHGPVIDG